MLIDTTCTHGIICDYMCVSEYLYVCTNVDGVCVYMYALRCGLKIKYPLHWCKTAPEGNRADGE